MSKLTSVRNHKTRNNGHEDFSDYSEFIDSMTRERPIRDDCMLTEAVVHDLETFIIRGLDLKQAAVLAGIPWRTFEGWRHRYPRFNEFIDKCLTLAESDALHQIQESMKGGVWQASAWFLERKWPNRYGKRDILKQEIYYKHMEFVKVVLEVINAADPAIRGEIVNRLRSRKIDFGDQG